VRDDDINEVVEAYMDRECDDDEDKEGASASARADVAVPTEGSTFARERKT